MHINQRTWLALATKYKVEGRFWRYHYVLAVANLKSGNYRMLRYGLRHLFLCRY